MEKCWLGCLAFGLFLPFILFHFLYTSFNTFNTITGSEGWREKTWMVDLILVFFLLSVNFLVCCCAISWIYYTDLLTCEPDVSMSVVSKPKVLLFVFDWNSIQYVDFTIAWNINMKKSCNWWCVNDFINRSTTCQQIFCLLHTLDRAMVKVPTLLMTCPKLLLWL